MIHDSLSSQLSSRRQILACITSLVIAPTLPTPDGKKLSEMEILQTKRNIENLLADEEIDLEVLKINQWERGNYFCSSFQK